MEDNACPETRTTRTLAEFGFCPSVSLLSVLCSFPSLWVLSSYFHLANHTMAAPQSQHPTHSACSITAGLWMDARTPMRPPRFLAQQRHCRPDSPLGKSATHLTISLSPSPKNHLAAYHVFHSDVYVRTWKTSPKRENQPQRLQAFERPRRSKRHNERTGPGEDTTVFHQHQPHWVHNPGLCFTHSRTDRQDGKKKTF